MNEKLQHDMQPIEVHLIRWAHQLHSTALETCQRTLMRAADHIRSLQMTPPIPELDIAIRSLTDASAFAAEIRKLDLSND